MSKWALVGGGEGVDRLLTTQQLGDWPPHWPPHWSLPARLVFQKSEKRSPQISHTHLMLNLVKSFFTQLFRQAFNCFSGGRRLSSNVVGWQVKRRGSVPWAQDARICKPQGSYRTAHSGQSNTVMLPWLWDLLKMNLLIILKWENREVKIPL